MPETEKPQDVESASTANIELNHVKSQRIRTYGQDIPAPCLSFDEMLDRNLISKSLHRRLRDAGYQQPTPIQAQTVPLMHDKRDIIACAPTGSGKTLAFILPVLEQLETIKDGQALIILPSRELAQQTYRECVRFAGKKTKVALLSKSNWQNVDNKFSAFLCLHSTLIFCIDVLISTPLRLVHALGEDKITLKHLKCIVIDEADKMFEMGFVEQIDGIFAQCGTSTSVQKALFSATIHSHIEALAGSIMKDPVRVVIGQKNAATESIKQKLVFVGNEQGKMLALRQIIQAGIRPPVLVFVDEIDRAKELFRELIYDGLNVDVIHSERTLAQRDKIVNQFRAGKVWVLIATELLGRGIDIKGVNLVINYDIPRSAASYIHRIGRTGRAGRSGEAVTFFTKEDAPHLKPIANVIKASGGDVPDWMLKMRKK